MSISMFLQPIDAELKEGLHEESLGAAIDSYLGDDFPDWEEANIILIGVQEDRASDDNLGSAYAPNSVREQLYKLFNIDSVKIADIGNILQGKSVTDTYKGLEEVAFEVLKKNKTLFVLGGSRDLTFSIYQAYGKLEQTVNFCAIDPRLNMAEYNSAVSPENYVNHIVLHQPNYLFNYSSVGYQTYLVPPSEIGLMEDLHFDRYRLGEVQSNIQKMEPVIRYADFLSVNVNAVRYSEIGLERADASPNGLYGEEICQLMRYAGISDKLSCAGLFDYNPVLNESRIGAKLMAQMFWCFADGVANRKKDFPIGDKSDYLTYHVTMPEDDHQVTFLKSDKSDRWWMKVPYPPHEKIKFERHHLIPCSKEDYEQSSKGVLPDLWLKTYHKLR